jgi:F0F1-type ATP synthase assembly protein I
MTEQQPDRPEPDKPPLPEPDTSALPHPDKRALPEPDNAVLAAGRFSADQTSASVIAYLVTGPALFGGLGWLLDRWLGTGFIVLLGMLAGMAMSLYVIWLRYGTQ